MFDKRIIRHCRRGVYLDTLLEQSVELVDLGRNAKVDRVAGKVDDETTLNGGVDLLNDLERLTVALAAICEPLSADSIRETNDLSRGVAEVTVTSTSPRYAVIRSWKPSITFSVSARRPFSARTVKRLLFGEWGWRGKFERERGG